jgi:hypothetical protein
VRLEGSLDAFSLPDIFSLLSTTKKTGGLHLRRDGAHGVVWFGDGAITGGSADLAHAGLARRIAGSGGVSDEQLEAAVGLVDETTGVAQALQQLDVDAKLLDEIVREHVIDVVFELLRWPDGDFGFELDEANPDDIGVSRPADDVVADARSRLETWTDVTELIPAATSVMAVVADPADDPVLSRDEWSLLVFIDGARTVADVVVLSGRGEYAAMRTLADLVARGLITAEGGGVTALLRRQQMLARLEGTTPPQAARDDAPANASNEAPALQVLTGERSSDEADIHLSEDPEPVAAAAGGGVAAMPSPAIDHDPDVSKSLLLRLIAGVRGL